MTTSASTIHPRTFGPHWFRRLISSIGRRPVRPDVGAVAQAPRCWDNGVEYRLWQQLEYGVTPSAPASSAWTGAQY